jgi:hypothetical protein
MTKWFSGALILLVLPLAAITGSSVYLLDLASGPMMLNRIGEMKTAFALLVGVTIASFLPLSIGAMLAVANTASNH